MPLEELAALQNRMLGPRVPRADWRGEEGNKKGQWLSLCTFFFNQGIALLKLRSRLSVDSRLKCSVPGNMDAAVKHQATVEQREPRYDERKNTVITDISKQFENGRAGLVMHGSVKVKGKKTDKAKRRPALSGQQRLWRWRASESVPGLDPLSAQGESRGPPLLETQRPRIHAAPSLQSLQCTRSLRADSRVTALHCCTLSTSALHPPAIGIEH